MCTLRTHQSTTCGFHLGSPYCDCSVIFPPECSKTSRIKNSVLRFQCWVSAHPPWPHRPAYTRTQGPVLRNPEVLHWRILRELNHRTRRKAIKRKVIRPSPLWWSSFYHQCRASRSAPRANHKAGCFQSCVLSPRTFSSPEAMFFVFAISPVTHLGKSASLFLQKERKSFRF